MDPALPSRQRAIIDVARAEGRVGVDDLAARLGVSAQTIRKDLNELCDQLLMKRVHGGAVVATGVENVAYEARRSMARDEKRAIGAAAARRIGNNASLFINIGTTTEEVARALGGHEGLLVITNNLNVATTLYRHPAIEVMVAGGLVRRADGAVVGSATVDFVRTFKVDYAVIGTSAIDPDGSLLDFDVREVGVSRAIIDNARAVVLVADRSKAERAAPARFGHLSEIDIFVTDALTSKPLRQICRTHGVEVVEAGSLPD